MKNEETNKAKSANNSISYIANNTAAKGQRDNPYQAFLQNALYPSGLYQPPVASQPMSTRRLAVIAIIRLLWRIMMLMMEQMAGSKMRRWPARRPSQRLFLAANHPEARRDPETQLPLNQQFQEFAEWFHTARLGDMRCGTVVYLAPATYKYCINI